MIRLEYGKVGRKVAVGRKASRIVEKLHLPYDICIIMLCIVLDNLSYTSYVVTIVVLSTECGSSTSSLYFFRIRYRGFGNI